jgi:hypothetical protein
MVDEPAQSKFLPAPSEAAREHFERALRLVRQARVGVTPEDRRAAFAAASSEFEKVLEVDADYPGGRTNLGYCLIELGRYGEAKSEIERAMQEFPHDVSALINYAVILQHNQRLEEAEDYLRRAMALDPKQGNVYRDLAYLLERRRRYRAAADNLERYLELTPHTNDERAARQRIKLLRQRAGSLELPDPVVTPQGITADLRWRAAALLLDGLIYAALWPGSTYLTNHLSGLAWSPKPVFVSLVYLYQLLSLELVGTSLGKLIFNLRVRSEREHAWFSPLALRETLKLAPLLISVLAPFPWNVGLVAFLIMIDGFTALRDRQGSTWYDRLIHTQVIEWDYRWWRILAGLVCLLSLLGTLLPWLK